MEPEASIIIRTRNEDRYLERLLRSIQEQAFTSWEIVLVDSGSTDTTADIARRFTPNIYQIPPEQFTFGRSLNIGCRHANGRYLVLVSAHTYPLNNNWLGNLLKPFEDPLIAMVYGRQRGVETGRVSEERDLELLFGMTSKILIDEPYGHNGNSAIRRDLWLDCPFDESLPGLEDRDWAGKMQQRGYRIYYSADAGICHIHHESLRQVYRRFFREGIAHRNLFPGYRFDKLDLVKGILYNIAADTSYAIRRKKGLRKIMQIPGDRFSEYFGRYRGLYFHGRLTKELRLQLYYDKYSEGVIIAGPGKHTLGTTEIPTLAPHDVLIQVAYTGVCATDVEVSNGSLEYYRNGHALYPIIPGHEYSGVIVDCGSAVKGFRKGDKVVGECAVGCGACPVCDVGAFYRCPTRKEVGVINMNGAYARHLKIPARYVHRLPRKLLLKEAALIEPLAVCLKGLRKFNINSGDHVCIVGAGPLGNLCAQILKHRGANVTAVDRNLKRLELLYKYDINTLTDLGKLDRFEYLIDVTGDETVLPRLIEGSKPSAKILLLGLPYKQAVPVCFSTVPCYDKEIYGSIASESKDWEEAIKLIRKRAINLDDHTRTVLPLSSYESAWQAVEARSQFKVLLAVNSSLDGV